jgi:DUF4097 and DUF4098 domain-containing protein YvlB
MKTGSLTPSLRRWLCSILIAPATVAFGASSVDSDLIKNFTVKPGGEVVLDADSGAIDVATGETSEVVIEVKRRITRASAADAEAIFKAHQVNFDRDGDQVRVTAKLSQDANRLLRGGRINFQVNYNIRVPKKFNLNLRTGAGNIAVAAIEGTIKTKTSGGNLNFDAITGPLEADTAAGNITSASISGTTAVKTSGGNINLGLLEAETTAATAAGSITVKTAKNSLALKSNGGNLNLGEVTGPADLSTAAGSITVKSARGKLTMKSNGGNLELGDIGGPADISTAAGSIRVKVVSAPLVAKTSGGNIHIEDARETVQARTAAGSISVGFSAQPKADCKLVTAGGNIDVQLADKLSFDIDAHTAGGRVSSELPVSTVALKPQRDTLQGKLNGGGTGLALQTSAGNISLRH